MTFSIAQTTETILSTCSLQAKMPRSAAASTSPSINVLHVITDVINVGGPIRNKSRKSFTTVGGLDIRLVVKQPLIDMWLSALSSMLKGHRSIALASIHNPIVPLPNPMCVKTLEPSGIVQHSGVHWGRLAIILGERVIAPRVGMCSSMTVSTRVVALRHITVGGPANVITCL